MKKALVILAAVLLITAQATADMDMWVLCQPDSYVYARSSPSRNSGTLGRLELGDDVQTDGKRKNGFLHCINLSFEEPEGWVYSGYLVPEEPEIIKDGDTYYICSNGRTACRRWIGGPRRAWAKTGAEFVVWAMTAEWAVTSRGFIKTAYMERLP